MQQPQKKFNEHVGHWIAYIGALRQLLLVFAIDLDGVYLIAGVSSDFDSTNSQKCHKYTYIDSDCRCEKFLQSLLKPNRADEDFHPWREFF